MAISEKTSVATEDCKTASAIEPLFVLWLLLRCFVIFDLPLYIVFDSCHRQRSVLNFEENIKAGIFHTVLVISVLFVGGTGIVFQHGYKGVALVLGDFIE